jgi:protein-S-isoprenylcysteine O-methyltransferase Ste14
MLALLHMSVGVLTLFLLDFALIGALPFIFFKKGSFNVKWFLTGAPYFLCAAVLFVTYLGRFPVPFDIGFGTLREALGVAFAAGSVTLIGFVLGTHQRPLALWHQEDDAPEHIVTHGAYARIRHPFYSSFQLALVGAFIVAPNAGTAATLAYGVVSMTLTAMREERRFLANEKFGTEYGAYMKRTGRFIPRLGS